MANAPFTNVRGRNGTMLRNSGLNVMKPTVTTQRLVVPTSGKPRHGTFDDLEPRLSRIEFSQIICMCVHFLRQVSPFWKE